MLQCCHAEELSFGPRALKDALLSGDPALRQLYASAFLPAERLFLAEAYNPQRTLFSTPQIRSAFDWLLSCPEPPEDFQTFHNALVPRKQGQGPWHIYLQPIDAHKGPVGGSLLDGLRGCAEAFFPGLQVKCLPLVPATAIGCHPRPGRDPEWLQLHTDGILSFLESHKPGDALCVLGLTLSDLYPCEAWSFTFGKSLPGHEVGVCSFAQFLGEFPQSGCSTCDPSPAEVATDNPKSPVQGGGRSPSCSALGLVHCWQATCHELCCLLGLGHCRWLRCLMQGPSAWTRPCGGRPTSAPSACGSCSTSWASGSPTGTRFLEALIASSKAPGGREGTGKLWRWLRPCSSRRREIPWWGSVHSACPFFH